MDNIGNLNTISTAESIINTAANSITSSAYYIGDANISYSTTTTPYITSTGTVKINNNTGSISYVTPTYEIPSTINIDDADKVSIKFGEDTYKLSDLIDQHNALIFEIRRLREEMRSLKKSLKKVE